MGGTPQKSSKLNNTLEIIVDIFSKSNYSEWFIAYGTLLGIVRENSCIQHDDDIDIMNNIANRDLVYDILKQNNIPLVKQKNLNPGKNSKSDGIIKTLDTPEMASIDFYFADVSDNSYYDRWEDVLWTDCHVSSDQRYVEVDWRGKKLNLPNNYIKKIETRYGKDWKTPKRKSNGGKGNKHIPL